MKRTTESNRVLGKDVDSAETEEERKRRAKQGGVRGESIVFQLYDLCGFDPVQDLVVDVMHSLTQLKLECTYTPPVNVLTHIWGVNDFHRCT